MSHWGLGIQAYELISMTFIVSKTETTAAAAPKMHKIIPTIMIKRFLQLVHLSLLIFTFNHIGKKQHRRTMNIPPTKANALVMFGNIMAVKPLMLTIRIVQSTCS